MQQKSNKPFLAFLDNLHFWSGSGKFSITMKVLVIRSEGIKKALQIIND